MKKLETTDIKLVDTSNWDDFVSEVYGRMYTFQQQEGCRDRSPFMFSVPSIYTNDHEMYDEIPEQVNGSKMGVKFKVWLEADPKGPFYSNSSSNRLFWQRNFYPDIYTVINDLYDKGLLDKGDYLINVDW